MAFKMVMGLWVTPDFADVEAGRCAPPYVNHSSLDFATLASAIRELFPYGPPVELQVPNDTIDQVTIHIRSTSPDPSTMRCSDFGKFLLSAAEAQKTTVVDVRNKWQPLHVLKDRDQAPPPVILPFVITAADFEDAMAWQASTRPCLGLSPFDVFASMKKGGSKNDEQQGRLPQETLNRLKTLFGTPFESPVLLDRMYTGKLPSYIPNLGHV